MVAGVEVVEICGITKSENEAVVALVTAGGVTRFVLDCFNIADD